MIFRYPRCFRILVVLVVFCFLSVVILHKDYVYVRPAFPSKAKIPTHHAEVTPLLHVQNNEIFDNTTQSILISPTVNPHDFSYIINPSDLCSGEELYMMIYVHTSPNNLRRRLTIRQTWANPNLLKELRAKIVFVIGMIEDKGVMDAILMESNMYGDIVQENFFDSYKNLTYKGIAALKWLHFHCNNTKYVLKTDDDILVNIYSLVKQIKPKFGEKSSQVLLCFLWKTMHPIRDPKSKWYVTTEEFAPKVFPPYCSGSAYLMSNDVANDLYRASFITPFFWVDDCYITGMLANKSGTKHTDFQKAYHFHGDVAMDKFKSDTEEKIVFYHVGDMVKATTMWKLMETRHGTMANISSFGHKLFSMDRS